MSTTRFEKLHGEPKFEGLDIREIQIHNPGALQTITREIGKLYRVTGGSFNHVIRDKNGEIISPHTDSVGYISFSIENMERRLYYAKDLVTRRVLLPPTKTNPMFTLSSSVFHDIEYRPDLDCIVSVGTSGVATNVIDPLSGESNGPDYHEIYLKHNRYWGTRGAHTEEIRDIRPLTSLIRSGII